MRAVVLVVVGMASILAGCGEVSAAATESTETDEGELIASSSAATQTISGGGSCTDVKALFEANADAVKALCADGEVAIPTAHDAEGCSLGQVKSLTLSCVTPKLPKDGEGKCFDLPVKPPKDRSDADADKACHEPSAPKPENLPAVLCPKLGAEPPPDGAGPGGDHKGPPPPPPDGAGPGGDHKGPPPPPPPGDKPEAGADGQHPAPPAGGMPPKAGGDKPAGPKAGGDKGARPPLRCCLPPKGGKDGKPPPPKGGPAGGPTGEQAGASAEGEGAQGLQ